jgi:hypothetical protein
MKLKPTITLIFPLLLYCARAGPIQTYSYYIIRRHYKIIVICKYHKSRKKYNFKYGDTPVTVLGILGLTGTSALSSRIKQSLITNTLAYI